MKSIILFFVLLGQIISLQPNDLNGIAYYTNVDNSITVSFNEQPSDTIPTYDSISLVGTVTNNSLRSVLFNIKSNTNTPVSTMLVLKSQSGRVWRNPNIITSINNLYISNNIPLTLEAGWIRDGTTDLSLLWAEDVEHIQYIGIRLTRIDRQFASYTIAGFSLMSDTIIPIILSPLQQALQDTFGIIDTNKLTDIQLRLDSDRDGMTDIIELLSNYDTEFANSIFAVNIIDVTDMGTLIEWSCVMGSKYTLIRTDSIMKPFSNVVGAVEITSTNTGFMRYFDNIDTKTSYFYKAIKQDK